MPDIDTKLVYPPWPRYGNEKDYLPVPPNSVPVPPPVSPVSRKQCCCIIL